jgi:hypothetical protein
VKAPRKTVGVYERPPPRKWPRVAAVLAALAVLLAVLFLFATPTQAQAAPPGAMVYMPAGCMPLASMARCAASLRSRSMSASAPFASVASDETPAENRVST